MPPRAPSNPYPWNGSRVLEVKRSSPIAAEAGVPQLYRFHLGPGDGPDVPINWEIPELGEIVQGRTKDSPMPIVRAKPTPGLTLAVRREGPTVLLYSVFKNGTLEGGEQLLLVDMEPLGSASLGQSIARIPPRNSLMSKKCRPKLSANPKPT